MERRAILGTLLVVILVAGGPLWATAAGGPWYASYERALGAQARGEWKESLRHLEEALAKKPEPQAQARTYGLRFVNYLPYFHMGLATWHPEKNGQPEGAVRSVTGEGNVIAVVPGDEQVVVDHGDIIGFMAAMTMGYKVSPASLLDGLNAGDQIRFTIDTQKKAIIKIEKLKP